jgi:hypothetical protein
VTDPLTAIAEAAEALTDVRQHREPRWMWDAARHRKPLEDHVTILPGLIQQLRDMVEPGTAEAGAPAKSVPDSRPPVTLDAVSLLASIEFGVARRCLELGITGRDNVEATIRLLVGRAPQLGSDTQRVLAAELRSWRSQAEVICRWRTGAVELVAPCPADLDGVVCGARGSLLANPDTQAAWCISCGTEWEPEQVESLFAHVRAYTEASRAAAEEARTLVREAKERQRRFLAEARARQVAA